MQSKFLLKDFDSLQVDLLKKYSNHPLLILFYNNNCLGCTGRAIPLAYNMQQQFSEIQVIGIHSNFNDDVIGENEIKRIFTIAELPFPIYIDDEHKTYDSFNCEGTPHWLLIDRKGELYRSFFGSQEGAETRLFYAIESLLETN